MFVTIQNLIEERTFLRFNSGRTHHLAPLETLKDVPHPEIKGNPKLEKLQQQHIIAIKQADAEAGLSSTPPNPRRSQKRRTTSQS